MDMDRCLTKPNIHNDDNKFICITSPYFVIKQLLVVHVQEHCTVISKLPSSMNHFNCKNLNKWSQWKKEIDI